MIKKNLMKTLSVVMAAMLAMMTVACGTVNTAKEDTSITNQITSGNISEETLEKTIMNAADTAGAVSESGKVETVYVTAGANGEVGDVIVSEWLKNEAASSELSDATQLKNIVNVKGSEPFVDNGDGTVTWEAEGSDIYYQGTTDKELPVKMKITYTLDGKEISPEDLAGKSGKVVIRFDYENTDKQVVNVDGKDIEVFTPFAMVSGMMLDSEKFTNVEVSNGKVVSDGGNTIVMGVAVPGLKESLDISDEKWEEFDEDGEIEDKLSDHFEVTADVQDFELGMTITMASSDILSDFGMSELTGSDKIEDLKDDMGKLSDGSTQLVDGSKELKDGTEKLADGSKELYDGTVDLKDGTGALYDGSKTLYNGTVELKDGSQQLSNGSRELANGTQQLVNGAGTLAEGTNKLNSGITSYTDATEKINDGAKTLADGTAALKAGSEKLNNGMNDSNLVKSAQDLATGSKNVSDGVATLVDKLSAMSSLMTKKAAINQKLYAVGLAKDFLEGTGECNDIVVSALSELSDGKINDAQTAIYVRDTALAKLQSQNSNTVQPEPNGEELVTDAQGGVLTNDEEGAGAGSADASGSGEEGSGENGGNPENGDGSGEGAPGNGNGSDEGAPDNGAGAPDNGAGGSDDGNGNGGSDDGNGNGGSEDKEPGSGEAGQGGEGAGDGQSGSGESDNGDPGETSDDPEREIVGAGDADSGDNAGAIYTQDQLDAAIAKAVATAKQETYNTIMAQVAQQQAAATAEVQTLMLYYGTYGAAKASYKILSETCASLEQVNFTQETIDDLNKLNAGAKQVADGNLALSKGIETIYNGAVALDSGIGQLNDGAGKLAAGTNTLVSNNASLKNGANALSTGAGQLSEGIGKVNDGAGKLADGASQLNDGAGRLSSGAGELSDGAKKLDEGAGKLSDGALELSDGAVKLDDGVQELLDGVTKLDEEGIQKLYDAFDGDLTEFADRISAIQEAGKGYTSFGGSSKDVDSSVKFIIKTDSIKTL